MESNMVLNNLTNEEIVSNQQQTDPDPKSALALGIWYSIVALIGTPMNLFLIITTLAFKSIRSIPLNSFVFSLALSDMLYLLSTVSQLFWGLYFDIRICKIAGVCIYMFALLSFMIPPCLAMCRYAVICSNQQMAANLKIFTRPSGIYAVNALAWSYMAIFVIPFVFLHDFGLDVIGICGIVSLHSPVLLVYYLVGTVGVVFASYVLTIVFYQKLDHWVRVTSSAIMLTPDTENTLAETSIGEINYVDSTVHFKRNRNFKWLSGYS
jgi:hypothetical protein